jgi:hypothetical protein
MHIVVKYISLSKENGSLFIPKYYYMKIPRSFISFLAIILGRVPSQHHDVPYLVRSQGIIHEHVRLKWETDNKVTLCIYGRSLINVEYVPDESDEENHRISRIVPLRLPTFQEIRSIGSGHVRSMYKLLACQEPILFRMSRRETDPTNTIHIEIFYDGKVFDVELFQEGEEKGGEDAATYASS